MPNSLNILANWLKIPFQIKLFIDPLKSTLEVKRVLGYTIMSRDSTLCYFSNNNSFDGFNHETKEQFINQCIYMYLYNLDEVKRDAMTKFVYWSMQGGKNLSNGLSWDSSGLINFDFSNVSIKTIAALNLLMTNEQYSPALKEIYELFMVNYIDNNFSLNYVSDPQNHLSAKFNEELKKVGFRREAVKLQNPKTYSGLGCSLEASAVLLASLKVLESVCKSKYYGKMFNKFNTLYGYGLKTKLAPASLETLTAVYTLKTLTKTDAYDKLLQKHLKTNAIDSEFANIIYSKMIGVL